MDTCPQHDELSRQIESQGQTLHAVHDVVMRLDHGLNGTDGSIGLIRRVENIEATVKENKGVWSFWRDMSGNLKFIVRMGMYSAAVVIAAQVMAKLGWVII